MWSELARHKLRFAALLLLGLGACQTIAGIEDRRLDPAADDPAVSEECKSYCETVMGACQGKNAVYTTMELCLGICANFEPGEEEEPVGNTLACRAFHAQSAELEPDTNCRFVGPGGGDVCGSDCEAYCDLYAKLCSENDAFKDVALCEKACGGLTDLDRFDVVEDHEGDTVECRLVHVSSAAIRSKASEHCPHAAVVPTLPWCIGAPKDSPTCDDYCNMHLAVCDGANTQYESRQQCLDVCGALEIGTNDDKTENTAACRRYHAFNSTTLPNQHCPHSGPAGDGHCGHDQVNEDTGELEFSANCEAYCTLLAAACPAQFDAEMGDQEQCQASCLPLDESAAESKYTLARAKASTGVSCRILHTARAFQDDSACPAAVGGDPCQ
jgi:hypothetical protein